MNGKNYRRLAIVRTFLLLPAIIARAQRERFVEDMDDRPYKLRGENLRKARALGLPEEYNRLALMCVSVLHLSHWRLDVTTTNYLVQ